MRILSYLTLLITALTALTMGLPQLEGLDIEVKHDPQGSVKTKRGDKVDVHYVGTLQDGTEFDQSYKRGQPLSFTVGQGQVIKGWDEGLLDMSVGEKRKLTIQPHLAYGDAGIGGVIPPKAVLIFETELVSINGRGKDEL